MGSSLLLKRVDKSGTTYSLGLLVAIVFICNSICLVNGQRSLLHWRRDLELRLEAYSHQKNVINSIIESSIHSRGQSVDHILGEAKFTDLIIPQGALIMDSHVAKPTLTILVNKTRDYVTAKMNELYHVRNQLDTIQQQLHDPDQKFIYKGSPHAFEPQMNLTVIGGTRYFSHLTYSHVIESPDVRLSRINYTDVDFVLRETYMENLDAHDSSGRLFFEGRKTFWKSIFARDLRSGCCDRLKPVHTNRVMLRSRPQDVHAPVLLQSNPLYHEQPAIIHNLNASQMLNRIVGMSNRPDDNGLIVSQPENVIRLENLISIRALENQPEIFKKLIFKDRVYVEEAKLFSPSDPRTLIGVLDNQPFDLSHEHYLLRSFDMRNNSIAQQVVSGTVILNGASHFLAQVEAMVVNRIPNFRQFVTENIVRVDRPSIIRGPVQFVALPTILSPISLQIRPPDRVLMMLVDQGMLVGSINGMRFPDDLVFLPPHPLARPFNEPIHVRGPKNFANNLILSDLVQVRHLINGIQMPQEVIPLHLNDFMSTVSTSNLVFVDGISVNHMTIQSGQFDELQLRQDLYDDAQNLIVRSVFVTQPDGTQIIRGPLRVRNLRVLGQGPGRGLFNGFRPTDIIELTRPHTNDVNLVTIYGKKKFIANVEATDCSFNDINGLTNWTSHLIRIDRPDAIQTVHTKLAFVPPALPLAVPYNNITSSSLHINHLKVDFREPKTQADHLSNWNYSPELYILYQALLRRVANQTGGRYRVLNRVRVMRPDGLPGLVNGISLQDIVTLNEPFRFAARFVLVGKVEIANDLRADRISSSYPIDAMDLIQFHKYRVPIMGASMPIQLNNLIMTGENKATFVQARLFNNTPLSEFLNSIMSLTRPQVVDTSLLFNGPVNLEGLVRTEGSFNGIKNFRVFAEKLKMANYVFENGLQCNTVQIKT